MCVKRYDAKRCARNTRRTYVCLTSERNCEGEMKLLRRMGGSADTRCFIAAGLRLLNFPTS